MRRRPIQLSDSAAAIRFGDVPLPKGCSLPIVRKCNALPAQPYSTGQSQSRKLLRNFPDFRASPRIAAPDFCTVSDVNSVAKHSLMINHPAKYNGGEDDDGYGSGTLVSKLQIMVQADIRNPDDHRGSRAALPVGCSRCGLPARNPPMQQLRRAPADLADHFAGASGLYPACGRCCENASRFSGLRNAPSAI